VQPQVTPNVRFQNIFQIFGFGLGKGQRYGQRKHTTKPAKIERRDNIQRKEKHNQEPTFCGQFDINPETSVILRPLHGSSQRRIGTELNRNKNETNQGMDLTVAVAQQFKRFIAAG